MADKPLYLTTTLPYVNAEPHIGFALEIVQADAKARFERLNNRPVFFNTGTDEHGQKIFQKAREEGRDVQEYVDEYAAKFQKLKDLLGLLPELHFIRTTDAGHVAAAQELWRRCVKDIEKRTYKGLYCVGDEMFLKESELVDGKCPNHPNMEPVVIAEENYFFKLTAYQQQLQEYLEQPGVIAPEWRRQEALTFVKKGLEDFSISRVKEKMPWGIPVPGDDSQVMYVWFDALTNYISTLGWPNEKGDFETFWKQGEVVQVAGKDQIRFQSIMWQAMLMSADIKPTDKVVYHGFITSGGQKMSKSLGNVIAPKEMVERYGIDATRYLLLRHVHPFEDTDITWERLDEWYTADLVNGLGNLVARVMQLAQTHLKERVDLSGVAYDRVFTDAMRTYEYGQATEALWSRIGVLDGTITETEPFKVVKSAPEKGRQLIAEAVKELATIDLALEPLMPETSKKIIDAIMANKKPENLFPRLS